MRTERVSIGTERHNSEKVDRLSAMVFKMSKHKWSWLLKRYSCSVIRVIELCCAQSTVILLEYFVKFLEATFKLCVCHLQHVHVTTFAKNLKALVNNNNYWIKGVE